MIQQPGPLTRLVLLAVPRAWRAPVASDLALEATRAGRRGVGADFWCAIQALRVALRFLTRRQPDHVSTRRPHAILGHLGSDLRLAWRALQRQPWSAVAIAMTLALGIGAATATFGVFNYALFRPVPGVEDPNRLVSMYFQFKPSPDKFYRTAVPHKYLVAMRDGVADVSGLAAYASNDLPFSQTRDGEPRTATVVRVTRGYFQVLGVRPRIGRLFTDDEYERPGPFITVMSEWLWRHEFQADPSVIGRDVTINAHQFTVIGVAANYRGPNRVDDEDLWVPLSAQAALAVLGSSPADTFDQNVIGRLKPGATVEQVQQQATAIFDGVGPFVQRRDRYAPAVSAGLTDGIGKSDRALLAIYVTLMTGVAMLFLVACANAANLMLARNLRRARDLAVRAAIGASRWRLVREGLLESAVLGVLAAGGGVLLAQVLAGVFRGWRLVRFVPLDDLTLDWRVAVFAGAAAMITVVIFGVGPAVLAARVDPQQGLKESSRTTPRGGRLRTTLVCLQLALSLALVAGTGVLVVTLARLESVNLGMNPTGLVQFSLKPVRRGYDDARTMTIFKDVLGRLQQTPSIESVTLTAFGPLEGGYTEHVHLIGQPSDSAIRVNAHFVTADYFHTLQIPLLSGRTFTTAEVERGFQPHTDDTVIVSASLATALFHTTDVVGRRIVDDAWGGEWEIVGVAGDVVTQDLRDGMKPAVYAPLDGLRVGTFLLRSAAPVGDITTLVRRTVHDVDPTLPAGDVTPLRGQIDQLLAEEHLFANLGVVVAGLAVGLAAFGVYAVIAVFVDERRREFGIRAALGAPRATAATLVLRRVAAMAGFAFPIGAGAFWLSSRALTSRVYGVAAFDPTTLTAAAMGLLLVALLAAWLPARSAARVDPIVVLRAE